MPAIKAVTVFGGAASGQDPAYRRAALALGEGLAQAGITVIYGGGGIGIMGAVADGALGAGGRRSIDEPTAPVGLGCSYTGERPQ